MPPKKQVTKKPTRKLIGVKQMLSDTMTVAATLAERGSRYGDFSNHAAIAMDFKDRMRKEIGWSRLTQDKQQALDVIADKIARVLNGDPEYKDNWHDIQGYAKLAEDRCREATPDNN